MTTFGYCRVSTEDQDLSIQRRQLEDAGCEMIREERVSGKSLEGRRELHTLLDFIREGDVLVVTKLDRLARNTLDMLDIIQKLADRGAAFKSLAEPWADTTTPAGKLMLTVMAGVAQFERERIKERQREGIDQAKAAGKYKGGSIKYNRHEIWRMSEAGMTKAAIARSVGCSEMTVYRALRGEAPA